jgi:hypothetical protein
MCREWIDEALSRGLPSYNIAWSNSLAIDSANCIQSIKDALGVLFRNRSCINEDDKYNLCETVWAYQVYFGSRIGLYALDLNFYIDLCSLFNGMALSNPLISTVAVPCNEA